MNPKVSYSSRHTDRFLREVKANTERPPELTGYAAEAAMDELIGNWYTAINNGSNPLKLLKDVQSVLNVLLVFEKTTQQLAIKTIWLARHQAPTNCPKCNTMRDWQEPLIETENETHRHDTAIPNAICPRCGDISPVPFCQLLQLAELPRSANASQLPIQLPIQLPPASLASVTTKDADRTP